MIAKRSRALWRDIPIGLGSMLSISETFLTPVRVYKYILARRGVKNALALAITGVRWCQK